MKLERNTERKCSMQVMSTTATTTIKQKFRFTRGFMLVLELKGFYSEASNILPTYLNAHSAISKLLTLAGLPNLASHQIQTKGSIIHQRKTLPFYLPIRDSLHRFLVIIITGIALQKCRIAYITYFTRRHINYQKQCNLIVAWIV